MRAYLDKKRSRTADSSTFTLTFHTRWMCAAWGRYTPFIPPKALSPLYLSPPLEVDPRGVQTPVARCVAPILTLRGRGKCVSACVCVLGKVTHTLSLSHTHTHLHVRAQNELFQSSHLLLCARQRRA